MADYITERIIASVKGRKIHAYDGWNGTSTILTAEDITLSNDARFYAVSGVDTWGNKVSISMLSAVFERLAAHPEAEAYQFERIDGCGFHKTYKIL